MVFRLICGPKEEEVNVSGENYIMSIFMAFTYQQILYGLSNV